MNPYYHIISSTLILHSAIISASEDALIMAHDKLNDFKSEDPEENELLLSIQDAIKVRLAKKNNNK